MRGIAGILAIFFSVMACDFSSNEYTCRTESVYNGVEAYLINENGTTYLSDYDDDLSTAIEVCGGEMDIPDSIGFNNIFSVDAILVDECENGQCLNIRELKNPSCVPTYTVEGANVEFYNQWYLAYIFAGNERVYPSCAYNSPSISFISQTDTTFATGRLGVNAIAFGVDMLEDQNVFLPGKVSVEDAFVSPYSKYIESQVANFFDNQDSVFFSITGNEMTLSNSLGNYGLLLYNR